jgi:hypothetical protein
MLPATGVVFGSASGACKECLPAHQEPFHPTNAAKLVSLSISTRAVYGFKDMNDLL